jgi:hypothetical protein
MWFLDGWSFFYGFLMKYANKGKFREKCAWFSPNLTGLTYYQTNWQLFVQNLVDKQPLTLACKSFRTNSLLTITFFVFESFGFKFSGILYTYYGNMFTKNWKNRSYLAQTGATYVNMPHAKVFEQVGILLTLRVLATFSGIT